MDSTISATRPAANTASKPRTTLLGALRKSTTNDSSESSAESDNGTSESEDDTPIPTRTLGSRPQPRMDSPEAAEESDADAAYQRMRKRLAAEKSKEAQNTQQDTPQNAQEDTSVFVSAISSGDDEEMPTRKPTRKILATTERTATRPATLSPRIRSRHSSPGLFVSPGPSPMKSQSRTLQSIGSDSDDSTQRVRNTELQERVKRIRAERLAKQKEEQAQRTQQAAQHSGSDTDGEVDRRLTQQSKPTRRAGKKALEAMARDQQRISRNMQLTHQSKTKKRFSTKDLFSRFGFDSFEETAAATLPTPEASSAITSSDAEANQMHETPPASPHKVDGLTEQEVTKVDKGKGRAPEFQHLPVHPWMQHPKPIVVQRAQTLEKPSDEDMVELSDSDDEVVPTQPKSRFPVFDRAPLKKQQEASSMVHLRHLAHLTSPKNSRKGPKTISLGEMNLHLAQKALEQRQKERQERLEDLKRRGIHIETAEEREKNQMEIEDIVAQFEKQRQEDLKLAKMEKKEAKENGEPVDDLPSSDDSDDDFVGSGEENADEQNGDESEVEIELSGSEDEDEEMAEADAADANEEPADASAEQQINEDADMDDEEPSVPGRKQPVNRARRRVIDDEDESDSETKPASPTQQATQNSTKAAFGFGTTDVGLGLTQMFAGTMANLESDSQATVAHEEPEQDSFDFLRSLPDTQPGVNFSQTDNTLVPNSQSHTTPRKESQFSLGISQLVMASPGFSHTQPDEVPEPTQDVGFSFSRSPAGLMPPPSTVETVMMSVSESPIKQRKGKLQRGLREAAVELSDVEEDLVDIESELSDVDDIQRAPKHRDAFRAMQKGAKKQKAIDEFNKKTSLAKNVVEEQADESEDEYAGLGGASDDDSGEEDEDMAKMIDHTDVKVDERQIAAFYADKAKRDDEKNVNQLYKDLMNGGLRKRAGRDAFDMSDSEDEAEMKQRKKRADFQRMRKALLGDENIGKIAENPKQQAFFKTLADFGDDVDYDFLDMPAEPVGVDALQSQSQSQEGVEGEEVVPDSQTLDSQAMPAPPNPLKRKSPSSQKENRPPPQHRRTAASDSMTRKPITLEDVQNSVSELLDDPRIMVPDSQYSSEEEEGDDEPIRMTRKTIVDRLTLSRQSTIETCTADSGLAFHMPSRTSTTPSFRAPSLMRQATSSLSTTSERSSGHSTPTDSGVRRGGTGRSNIHAQAREAERRAVLEKKESRRKEALKRKVDVGRKSGMRSVLGDLGGGFE